MEGKEEDRNEGDGRREERRDRRKGNSTGGSRKRRVYERKGKMRKGERNGSKEKREGEWRTGGDKRVGLYIILVWAKPKNTNLTKF